MSDYLYIPVGGTESLSVFSTDPVSGQIDLKHEVPLGKSGHAVCADSAGKWLYVGLGAGDTYAIAAYAIDPQNGGLSALGEVAVEGMPCYLSTDKTG